MGWSSGSVENAMLPLRKPMSESTLADGMRVADSRGRADEGLVFVDSSLRIIAADRGASSIFNHRGYRTSGVGGLLPAEIAAAIRAHNSAEISGLKIPATIEGCDYMVRAYRVDWPVASAYQPVWALLFERGGFASEVMDELGAAYRLTQREREAFAGVLRGLSTKELAQQMNISPNTVKAFLRLIMIKMGVTTRAGILARILHDRTGAAPNGSEGLPLVPEEARAAGV